MANVIIINGPINSGKTTISQELQRRLPQLAHIEVDDLRHFISWMDLEESISLNLKNTVAVGKVFLDLSFVQRRFFSCNSMKSKNIFDQLV